MVQTGLNSGPRHARIIGFAKSFVRKLSDEAKIKQDEAVIGGASMIWNIMRAFTPEPIIANIDQTLADLNLPRLATRNVAPGEFYNYSTVATLFLKAHRN